MVMKYTQTDSGSPIASKGLMCKSAQITKDMMVIMDDSASSDMPAVAAGEPSLQKKSCTDSKLLGPVKEDRRKIEFIMLI